MTENDYMKPNATISTENFGNIERKKYKSFIESYAMYKCILGEINEHSLPLKITFEVTEDSIYKEYIERIVDKKNVNVSDEQRKFEIEKSLGLIGHILNYTSSITNR